MKAVLTVRLSGLGALALLLAACSLFTFSPSLTLDVQSTAYTGSTVKIPYSFATLSSNSGMGSADCVYRLMKYDSNSGGYTRYVDESWTNMQDTGTLSFDLPNLLGVAQGSSAIDGLYRLSFAVLSGNYDQNGNPIPIPYLTKTAKFTVHTFDGPEIFAVSPAFVNPSTSSSVTLTVIGAGFSPSDTLECPTYPSAFTPPPTYVSSNEMTATLNLSAVATPTAPNVGSLDIDDLATSGTTSPSYSIPVIGVITVTQIVPTSASRTNSHLPLAVYGDYLGYWTSVVITDSSGNSATLQIAQTGSSASTSYVFGYIDLTSLSAGSDTLTAYNPDGSYAPITFTVTN